MSQAVAANPTNQELERHVTSTEQTESGKILISALLWDL